MKNIRFETVRQGLRLLVILASVMMTYACSGCCVLKPEDKFSNMISDSPAERFSANTLGLCYHNCALNVGCMSFFYNRITKVCQLHEHVFLTTEQLVTADGYHYYIMECDPCSRNAGYLFNRKLGVCFALLLSDEPYTLGGVRHQCRNASGGRLMTVDSEEKHVMIRETAKHSYANKNVSIGLSRPSNVAAWRWEDNQTLVWSKWIMRTEPCNESSALCAFMSWVGNFDWSASQCSQSNSKLAACEI